MNCDLPTEVRQEDEAVLGLADLEVRDELRHAPLLHEPDGVELEGRVAEQVLHPRRLEPKRP